MEASPVGGAIIEPVAIQRLWSRPALSERSLIDKAIRFANTGDPRNWFELMEGVDLPEPSPALVTRLDAEERFKKSYAPEREAFRDALTTIVAKQTTPALVADWSRRASGLLLHPTFHLDSRGLRATYRYIVYEFFPPPSSPFAYVLMLLLDTERSFGGDLCQCQLDRCGEFFFAIRPKTGLPRRLYCTPEHMTAAHRAGAVERVRKSRKARAKAKLEKRRR